MELPVRKGKRKPESQENERLSKRLSLLNIEQNGAKLYVPVETPSSAQTKKTPPNRDTGRNGDDDEMMRIDDSKHKVYIYNIDDELSSDSESEEGKLIFLPDIQKHLKESRIPRALLLRDDTEAEGKELVVYSDPKSLSVPENKDSVRKAIIESRRRMREERRRATDNAVVEVETSALAKDTNEDAMDMDL